MLSKISFRPDHFLSANGKVYILSYLKEIVRGQRSFFSDVKDGETLIKKCEHLIKASYRSYSGDQLRETLSKCVEILKLNKDYTDALAKELNHYANHGDVHILGVNDMDPHEDPEGYSSSKGMMDYQKRQFNEGRKILYEGTLKLPPPEPVDEGYWSATASVKISKMLDGIADRLEAKGLIKEAYEIDKIADYLDYENFPTT